MTLSLDEGYRPVEQAARATIRPTTMALQWPTGTEKLTSP
jgi:hypothetical protein